MEAPGCICFGDDARPGYGVLAVVPAAAAVAVLQVNNYYKQIESPVWQPLFRADGSPRERW